MQRRDTDDELGVAPDSKYEKDGGPGMEACLKLLAGSADAEADRLAFQLAQLAFWLMAATDGHAKNYSIFIAPRDAYTMTPLYDVISVWPYIGEKADQLRWRSTGLAMALRAKKNAHHVLQSIQARHWHALAMRHGGPAVWNRMPALAMGAEAFSP